MKKKAQIDLEPMCVLMAVCGAIFGWYMAGTMEASFIWKILTALLIAVVGYFISYKISEGG